MDRSKTPHACFKTEGGTSREAQERFIQILAQHLRARLDGFRVVIKHKWFVPAWMCEVQVGGKSFALRVFKSEYADDEMILLVGPLSPPDTPGLLGRLRGRTPKPYTYLDELRGICREIHALLSTTTGISRVRWYFESRENQAATGFATPDELPW